MMRRRSDCYLAITFPELKSGQGRPAVKLHALERMVRVLPEQRLELVADRGFDVLDRAPHLLEDAPADPGHEDVRTAQRTVDVIGPEQSDARQEKRALGLSYAALHLEGSV